MNQLYLKHLEHLLEDALAFGFRSLRLLLNIAGCVLYVASLCALWLADAAGRTAAEIRDR